MLIWFNWDRHVSECENNTSIGQTGGLFRKAMNFIKAEKCKWFQSELKLSTGLGTNCRGLGLKWGFFVLASLLFSSSANGHKYGSTAFQPLATLKKTRVTEAGSSSAMICFSCGLWMVACVTVALRHLGCTVHWGCLSHKIVVGVGSSLVYQIYPPAIDMLTIVNWNGTCVV